jgi:alkylation response protein AidB-like acyl-CoA dehydrogenase
MIETTVERLLARFDLASSHAALREGTFPAALWESVLAAGLPLMLSPESAGGIGLGFDNAAELARLCGAGGLPLPIIESLIGNWLLGLAGVEPRENPVSPTIGAGSPLPESGHFDQPVHAHHVPWARYSDLVVVATHGHGLRIALVPQGENVVTAHGANMAGEPRDRVDLSICNAKATVWRDLPADLTASTILARMALLRAALMVGAMERALQLSVTYTSERHQFGRSLSSFQVIQQTLAAMATQVAAARSAVDVAAVEADPERIEFMAAVAKARTGDAATIVAASAHQVHGAMGFTQEYGLGLMTKRLWSWRSEDGSESHWHQWLGARARANGDLWALIAA